MKKLASFILVLIFTLSFAIPVMANDNVNLYKDANQWYAKTEIAGMLTVSDNKQTYQYDVVAGVNQLGSQSGYIGQLQIVSFIGLDTIITQDNIQDVLKYLNIDTKNFIPDSSNSNSANQTTVKELQDAIQTAQSLPKTVEYTATAPFVNNLSRAISGTKTLFMYFTLGSAYIEYSVSAGFSGKTWTSAYGGNIAVSSTNVFYTYTLTKNPITTTFNSTNVYMC